MELRFFQNIFVVPDQLNLNLRKTKIWVWKFEVYVYYFAFYHHDDTSFFAVFVFDLITCINNK